jgi:hypothetical protein
LSCAAKATSATCSDTEDVRCHRSYDHAGHREEQQLGKSFTSLEALDVWGLILNKELYGAAIIGIDDPWMDDQTTPKDRTATQNLSIPARR